MLSITQATALLGAGILVIGSYLIYRHISSLLRPYAALLQMGGPLGLLGAGRVDPNQGIMKPDESAPRHVSWEDEEKEGGQVNRALVSNEDINEEDVAQPPRGMAQPPPPIFGGGLPPGRSGQSTRPLLSQQPSEYKDRHEEAREATLAALRGVGAPTKGNTAWAPLKIAKPKNQPEEVPPVQKLKAGVLATPSNTRQTPLTTKRVCQALKR